MPAVCGGSAGRRFKAELKQALTTGVGLRTLLCIGITGAALAMTIPAAFLTFEIKI